MKTGVFDQGFIDSIRDEWEYNNIWSSFEDLQNYLVHYVNEETTANKNNKMRICTAILRARNYEQLLMVMYNHLLAHPSEGLKVI